MASSNLILEYGPNPIGYLMYDPTGHMCVSLANPNHPHWANPEKPTDAEKLRSYDEVESRTGAVALASRWLLGWAFASPAAIRFGLALFPVPAHRTGQAELPHPALGKDARP
jgi:hypothetical protein